MIVFYYFSPRVTRSVVYGPRARNTLDIYLPRHHMRDLQDPIPVVIYITGAPTRSATAAQHLLIAYNSFSARHARRPALHCAARLAIDLRVLR